MHIISRKKLVEFWKKHPDSEEALRTWLSLTRKAKWTSCIEISQNNANARCLPNERVCFNIKGNNYRLVVKVEYTKGRVFIRFIGTHAEYDGINPTTY